MLNNSNCNDPLVSIIIPVYNGANYLREAIDSALSQTYRNIEIIVVNDGSDDDGKTEQIANSYDDRIRYYKKENGGVSSALNFGIEKMHGDYFSWLSHDDLYAKTKVEDSIQLLKKHGLLFTKTIAFTGGHYIGVKGNGIRPFKVCFKKDVLYSGFDSLKIMVNKGTLNGCRMLIPRKAFFEVGKFDESLRYSQDSLMWYSMFFDGYSIISDDCDNVCNRLHKMQVSQLRRNLYENDALYIARLIAPKLYSLDNNGCLFIKYGFRLAKSGASIATRYMVDYLKSSERGIVPVRKLQAAVCLGRIRYYIIHILKKLYMTLT